MKGKNEEAHKPWERMGEGWMRMMMMLRMDKDGDVDRLWPEVDKDKSGTVSMDELFSFMRAKKEEKAHERWERMDKDGDGELTKQEVKDGQDKFSDDKVDDMWPLLDKDKNGTISFDEFFAFMKAKANGSVVIS